jgi:hypothetical protein
MAHLILEGQGRHEILKYIKTKYPDSTDGNGGTTLDLCAELLTMTEICHPNHEVSPGKVFVPWDNGSLGRAFEEHFERDLDGHANSDYKQ